MYKQELNKLKQNCTEYNMELVEWFFDQNYLNCFWYDSDLIARIDEKSGSVNLHCYGSNSCSILNDSNEIQNIFYKSEGEAMIKDPYVRDAIQNDATLQALIASHKIRFSAKSHIELIVKNKNGKVVKTITPKEENVFTAMKTIAERIMYADKILTVIGYKFDKTSPIHFVINEPAMMVTVKYATYNVKYKGKWYILKNKTDFENFCGNIFSYENKHN